MKTFVLILMSFLIGWLLGVIFIVLRAVKATIKTLKEKNLLKTIDKK